MTGPRSSGADHPGCGVRMLLFCSYCGGQTQDETDRGVQAQRKSQMWGLGCTSYNREKTEGGRGEKAEGERRKSKEKVGEEKGRQGQRRNKSGNSRRDLLGKLSAHFILRP